MSYGITTTGFALKPLDVIKSEIEADLRATFGAGINLEPQSNFGQLVGIFAERYSDLWQIAEAIYTALTADGAADAALDLVAALTGTARNAPKLTHVIATCSGTPGTVLPSGRVASITGTGARFVSLAPATIGGGGTVSVEFAAELAGPTPAYAGTLTTIETPLSGWTAITNPTDHTLLGANLETDPDLRLRRELELRSQGNAAVAPVRAKVRAVKDVIDAFVFENDGDTVDTDGMPPHSIECVVDGGLDADIRAAIFASKAGGIATTGTVSGSVTDSQGTTHTIKHSRPAFLDAYVTVRVSVDPGVFPADGDDQIKASLIDYAAKNYTCGSDVISSAFIPQVFKVKGVVDAPLPYIGLSPTPATTTTIVTTLRQKPRLDTSRITVQHI
jgi:uncharacterized phage protein gp47/JayE